LHQLENGREERRAQEEEKEGTRQMGDDLQPSLLRRPPSLDLAVMTLAWTTVVEVVAYSRNMNQTRPQVGFSLSLFSKVTVD
jgi:hypothetical protein